MTMKFAGKTAIAGIGATEFSKESGRSTLRLAVECAEAAILDAGLRPEQIDGMVNRFRDELGSCTVVATGGLAHVIAPVASTIEHVEPFLTLHGLRLVYERNR